MAQERKTTTTTSNATDVQRNDNDLSFEKGKKFFFPARLHANGFYIEFVIDAFDEICRSRGQDVQAKAFCATTMCVTHKKKHVWAFRYFSREGKRNGGGNMVDSVHVRRTHPKPFSKSRHGSN